MTELGLPVDDITLEERFDLYVGMRIKRRQAIDVVTAGGPMFLNEGKWIMQVPLLGAPTAEQNVLVHFDCAGFDSQAPTAELMDEHRVLLPDNAWPQDLKGGGVVFGHPDYPRAYFCRPLLREYHTHPEHADNSWDKHREGTTLHGIVVSLLGALHERWIL